MPVDVVVGVLVLALTSDQTAGLIPPRYDLTSRTCSTCSWNALASPGSPRLQKTSYRVFNSAGPLPPYSFTANSAGPRPPSGYKPVPASTSVGFKKSHGHSSSSGGGGAGPKVAPGYSVTASGGSPNNLRDYSVSTNSAGPKAPVFSIWSSNSVGPKPPPGYLFSAGPKPARHPSSSSASASASAEVQTSSSASASARTQARAQAQAQVPSHALGQVQTQTRVRVQTPAQPDSAATLSTEHQEKLKTLKKKQFSSSRDHAQRCGASCPAYQLQSRTVRYEVRLYPALVWATFVTTTENRLLAEMEALAGIEDYLAGQNSRGVALPRSYPALTQMHFSPVHGSSEQESSDFSISVPLLSVDTPPRPSTDQLVLDSVDRQRVYVMTFWARPWKLTERALRMRTKRFSRRVRRRGQTFLDAYFYLAKYKQSDSTRRSHYEIWLYGTPHESTHRFRPAGRRLLDRPSNVTIATMRRLCRGLECPRFEVLSEFEGGIQKRHYYNAAFATSRLERCEPNLDSIWQSLMPLHLYRQGVNSHLERIELTRPAGLLRVWRDGDSSNDTACHMTAMVYLPRRLHRSPPNTGDSVPTIGLSFIHELTVYVVTTGDLELTAGRLQEHVSAVHSRLDALGLCYRRDEHFVAVYDAERRYHGRVNEIWTVARPC